MFREPLDIPMTSDSITSDLIAKANLLQLLIGSELDSAGRILSVKWEDTGRHGNDAAVL